MYNLKHVFMALSIIFAASAEEGTKPELNVLKLRMNSNLLKKSF